MEKFLIMNYIASGFAILAGILVLIGLIFKLQNDSKNKLLVEMFENDDITKDVYLKYKLNIDDKTKIKKNNS